jgi:sulfate adenylyltransferase subunit 1 (EFTu-like GTPase family)
MSNTKKAGADAPADLTLEQAVARIAELETELAKSKSAQEVSSKELEDAATVVADLKEQLKEAASNKGAGHFVTIDKVKYRVIGGTVINKKPFTPADIAADKELAKQLIEKGSSLLTKIS